MPLDPTIKKDQGGYWYCLLCHTRFPNTEAAKLRAGAEEHKGLRNTFGAGRRREVKDSPLRDYLKCVAVPTVVNCGAANGQLSYGLLPAKESKAPAVVVPGQWGKLDRFAHRLAGLPGDALRGSG